MKRRYILTLISLLSLNTSVSPISENTANIGSIGGGAVTGALSAWLTSLALNQRNATNDTLSPSTKYAIAGLVGAGVGGLTWYGLNQYLHTLTPTGRFRAASDLIMFAETDSFITRKFQSVNEIINHANGRFGTSWPLVLARNHCMTIRNSLSTAYSLLSASNSEAMGKFEYGDLCARCCTQQNKIQVMTELLEQRVNAVVENESYHFQVKLHEEYLEQQRALEAQRQEKQRDRAHESYEKNKDRLHESFEKYNDRLLKEKLVQSASGPVMIKV